MKLSLNLEKSKKSWRVNDKMNQKEIELAKSWFTLAKIFMLLAGFMFAASGILYNGAIESTKIGFDYLIETQKICSNNLTQFNCENMINATNSLLELPPLQADLWRSLFGFGGIVSLLALISWGFGYFILWRIKNA